MAGRNIGTLGGGENWDFQCAKTGGGRNRYNRLIPVTSLGYCDDLGESALRVGLLRVGVTSWVSKVFMDVF